MIQVAGRRMLGVSGSARALVCIAFAIACGATRPDRAAGQSALVLETRAGVAVPVGSFTAGPGGGALGAAPAVGLHFGLRPWTRTYLYLGFAQIRTDCARDGCAREWVSTQWDAGVRMELASGRWVPWVRAGILTPTVERVPLGPGPEGRPRRGTSERGWGGELGAGVRIGLTERLSLSPGARWVAADVGRRGAPDLRMRQVVADVGLVVGF